MTLNISKKELEGLALINCTLPEFCGFFRCQHATIYNKIREYYDLTFKEFVDQYAGQGKVSLRRQGWREALSGKNWPATKFLMENELGMGDNVNNTLKGFDGGSVKSETISKTAEEAKADYLDMLKKS